MATFHPPHIFVVAPHTFLLLPPPRRRASLPRPHLFSPLLSPESKICSCPLPLTRPRGCFILSRTYSYLLAFTQTHPHKNRLLVVEASSDSTLSSAFALTRNVCYYYTQNDPFFLGSLPESLVLIVLVSGITSLDSTCATRTLPLWWSTMVLACARPDSPGTTPPGQSSPPSWGVPGTR